MFVNGLTAGGKAWLLGTRIIKLEKMNRQALALIISICMVSRLQVGLNFYLSEFPRKIHLEKCMFTFSENVTNYALFGGVQNVEERRTFFFSSIH